VQAGRIGTRETRGRGQAASGLEDRLARQFKRGVSIPRHLECRRPSGPGVCRF
jgi:hypothetical protein